MEVKKAGASLDSVISGFNRRIAELQDLVIARNMYPASSVTDLSAVDAALKGMELQVQAIKDRLRDETLAIPKAKKLIDAALKQQKKLQDMAVYVPSSHVPERMSKMSLDSNRCLLPEGSQQSTGFGSLKLEEEPAPQPKEKKGRAPPPLWFITAEELDSLSGYMKGRLTVEKINSAIQDMATFAEANAQLIFAPKKKVAGDNWERALVEFDPVTGRMKNSSLASYLELRDIAMTEGIKGKHFFLETDMKGPALKLDNTGKAILTVLRHLGRVSETRIGSHRVIILLKRQ